MTNELPPLPEANRDQRHLGYDSWETFEWYSADQMRAYAQSALAQQAAAPAPAGWKLVPDTATHNMLNAASAGRKKGRSSSGEIYRTMIDAAPPAALQKDDLTP